MKSKLIDPRLDEIPVDEVELTGAERAKQLHQRPIPGLSINDTIAHNANQSIGARGVDTSTVETGEPERPDPTVGTPSEDELS